MESKLKAARLVTVAGGAVIMANGSVDAILEQVFAGEAVGTLFLPQGQEVSSRKRWFGLTVRPKGVLFLDSGACQAVLSGKSLLPVGVTAVAGEFGKGAVVSLRDPDGKEIARGLSNYSADVAERIRGLQSDRILTILGGVPYAELVHRDNLVVVT
jgi:glutamate 5-kinase